MDATAQKRVTAAFAACCLVLTMCPASAAPNASFAAVDAAIAESKAKVASLTDLARTVQATGARSADTALDESKPSVTSACRAVVTGNIRLCDALPKPGNEDCRNLYLLLSRTKILVTGTSNPSAARQLCLSTLQAADVKFPITHQQFCETYVAYAGNDALRVQKLKQLMNGDPEQNLKDDLLYSGEQKSCPAARGENQRLACHTAILFRRAATSKDRGACGASGLCRALDGNDLAACTTFERLGPTRQSVMSGAEAEQKKLNLLVSNLDSIDFQGAAGSAGRRSQVVALIKQCDALIRRFAPSAPAAKRGAKAPSDGPSDR